MPDAVLTRDRRALLRAAGYSAAVIALPVAMVIAAATEQPWLVLVFAVVGVGGEFAMRARAVNVAGTLASIGAGLPLRSGLAAIAVVLLAARGLVRPVAIGTAATVVVVVLMTAGFVALRRLADRLATPPLQVRNLDLGVAVPRGASRIAEPPGTGVASMPVIALGLAIDWHSPATTAAAVCLAIAAILAVLPAIELAARVAIGVRGHARQRLADAARAAIERLGPQVIVYFASTPGEVYQADQWLRPVEALGVPAAVMVRSTKVMDALAPTRLPVICSPYNGTIAALPLPDRVVVLFPTHSGNNLSMIRRPETRTVFVGHGESDKPDSVNPFAKVYDEVWVAGPLGRRRYASAAVGVADAAIIEIGRPQTDPTGEPPTNPPIVVYAPTWEGWGDDPHHSSLAYVGPALIRALTQRSDVAVRYRPHPLTGHRSPALRAAHDEIVAMIGAVDPSESLSDTLGTASGVIADVSSVIAEFLPYDRPYAVCDTRGLGQTELWVRFPSTSGGFVIEAGLAGLTEFVDAVTTGSDRTASARRVLLRDALGDPATSGQRFAAAVDTLLKR